MKVLCPPYHKNQLSHILHILQPLCYKLGLEFRMWHLGTMDIRLTYLMDITKLIYHICGSISHSIYNGFFPYIPYYRV